MFRPPLADGLLAGSIPGQVVPLALEFLLRALTTEAIWACSVHWPLAAAGTATESTAL